MPNDEDRATVHRIISEEMVAGRIKEASRTAEKAIIARLVESGAEAINLGCTEIMLLVGPEDSSEPIFDTTALHAETAIEYAADGSLARGRDHGESIRHPDAYFRSLVDRGARNTLFS